MCRWFDLRRRQYKCFYVLQRGVFATVLHFVRVLVLVDVNVFETLLVFGADVWMLFKEHKWQEEQVIKVDAILFFEIDLVETPKLAPQVFPLVYVRSLCTLHCSTLIFAREIFSRMPRGS